MITAGRLVSSPLCIQPNAVIFLKFIELNLCYVKVFSKEVLVVNEAVVVKEALQVKAKVAVRV